MKLFFDTSAFAKRYISERGTEKVIELCEGADSLAVSVICFPEYISTLSRLLREKRLAKSEYKMLKEAAMRDLADVDICQITNDVLSVSVTLLETNLLRTTDALHIACAVAVAPDVFVSADHRQLVAAKKAGIKTIDVS